MMRSACVIPEGIGLAEFTFTHCGAGRDVLQVKCCGAAEAARALVLHTRHPEQWTCTGYRAIVPGLLRQSAAYEPAGGSDFDARR